MCARAPSLGTMVRGRKVPMPLYPPCPPSSSESCRWDNYPWCKDNFTVVVDSTATLHSFYLQVRRQESPGRFSQCVATAHPSHAALPPRPQWLNSSWTSALPVWLPTPGSAVRVLPRQDWRQACVTITVKVKPTPWMQVHGRARNYPFWNYATKNCGRNHVMVDFSDAAFPPQPNSTLPPGQIHRTEFGTWNSSHPPGVFIRSNYRGWKGRSTQLGCGMLALSNTRPYHYQPTLGDVSLPLGLRDRASEGGMGSALTERSPPAALLAALSATRALDRKYWLTFRGGVYLHPEPGSIRQHLLYPPFIGDTPETSFGRPIDAHESADRPVAVAATCSGDGYIFAFIQRVPELRRACGEAEKRKERAPSYKQLLNTTFALVPEGRQAATYRLDEVMAAGAIPVFLSDPFVPPFAQRVDWQAISVRASRERAPQLLQVLGNLTSKEIVRMQHGVRRAWRAVLEPAAASRSFYDMLRARVSAGVPRAFRTRNMSREIS